MKKTLKFKTDENLPIEIAEYISTEGYDVMTVVEQGLKGADDCRVADICQKEDRIIVTLDLDFSDIRTYSPDEYSGIIVIRVREQSKSHILKVFKQVIDLLKKESIQKRLWIIEEDRIRIRGE